MVPYNACILLTHHVNINVHENTIEYCSKIIIISNLYHKTQWVNKINT